MRKKVFLLMLVVFAFTASMVFAGGKKEGSEKKEFIQIKSSSIGGSWYACGAAWAKLISDNTDYIASNSASPGLTNESIKRMSEGKAHLAVVDGTATYAAYKGNAPWEEPVPVRALFAIWPGVINIIVNEGDDINSISDLKGKSIATYAEGEPTGMAFLDLLNLVGVNDENTRIYRIMKNDATRMFIDGSADCLLYAFGYGHAKLKEISTARKIKFIHTDIDTENKFIEKYPYYISADFGEEFGAESAKQFLTPYFLIAMDNMSDEQAYEFTKVWWENWDFIEEVLPSNAPYINRENPMAGVPVPQHPGALKYFKEKGIIQ